MEIRHDGPARYVAAQHVYLLTRAGDIRFVVTSNGVDEGRIHLPAPEAPSFLDEMGDGREEDARLLTANNASTWRAIGLLPGAAFC